MSDEHSPLPFTGERFTPECVREIWYEHWHRYAFARSVAAGKRVLDAACGEGFGSALLAQAAAEVVGVDIDAASVEHARARYAANPKLSFECADAAKLPFADRSFDVIVSFETLEHLAEQEQMIAGFARVLRDDGVLLVSSPDKHTYSDVSGFRNEFHVRELYRDELLDLLRPHFQDVRLYGQKLLFQSVLWNLEAPPRNNELWTAERSGESLNAGLDYAPLYFIAACSKSSPTTALPDLSLFGDRGESVYEHYNHEIRKNMSAGTRIAELEAEIAELRAAAQTQAPSAQQSGGWRWWRRRR